MFTKYLFYCSLILYFLVNVSISQAMTVAIIPIEDLSQGSNGINKEVTDYLAWELSEKGLDVISNENVEAFMVRNRMRWLGFLDTKHIIKAKDELGADLVLFGTITLGQNLKDPSLGLTLYLARSDDSRTLWSASGGLCQDDIISLLGIGDSGPPEGLVPLLAQRVLEDWPDELEFIVSQQPPLEIEYVDLRPSHVRRGDQVSCSVSLRTKWSETDMPRLFFKVGGRVHLARQSPDGYSYESNWVVSDRDGRYPVTMVVDWPSGNKKVTFLGAYNVDSAPPKLVLELKGVRLEGTVAFRDQVIILPHMIKREPVARWKITIEDEAGEEQMSRSGYGNLPRQFVWNGRKKSGWLSEEGIYEIMLQVWDRAENLSVTSQQVAIARTPPAMVLEAKNLGRDMIVDLNHEGQVPIAFWRMEVRGENGEIIKVAEGDNLPFRMDIQLPNNVIKVAKDNSQNIVKVAENSGPNIVKVAENEDYSIQTDIIDPLAGETRKVECIILMRDVLGNQSRQVIKDIQSLVAPEVKEGEKTSSGPAWLDEF
ncbi:MAG: hypothetical protein KKB30_08755 [Proteobacteria bacterium]|nr:hypothetical protein [Pseudomonadota bacterium]MBU1716888.1 hypothetical protein [Pseudomonadota bacterium]